jgi:hypothetical protein
MSERWERELVRLREVDMPERVRLRSDDGPHGQGMPPSRQRILTAVLAFVVFAAAGGLLWEGFRPADRGVPHQDDPQGDRAGGAVVVVTIRRAIGEGSAPDHPFARAGFGDRSIGLCPDGWTLYRPDGSTESVDFDCEQDRILRAPAGAAVTVQGDYATIETSARELVERSEHAADSVPDLPPDTVVTYRFAVAWADGSSASFWLHLTVAPPEGAAVVRITRTPLGATLTFGERTQEGLVTDTWLPSGDIYDGHRVDLPSIEQFSSLIEVPPSTELTVLGDVDGWTVFPQPPFEPVTLSSEPGPAVFILRTGWKDLEFDVAFGIDVVSAPDSSTVADSLDVRCVDERAELSSSSVAVQPDGLHLDPVDVDAATSIGVKSSAQPGTSWWSGSGGVDQPFVRPVPPGEITVVCTRDGGTERESDARLFEASDARVDLVDPEGFFRPYLPECPMSEWEEFGVRTTDVDPQTAIDVIRSFAGVLATDLVEPAGYPRGWPSLEDYRILRDEVIIARVMVSSAGGGTAHVWACRDSGIRGYEA